MSYKEWGRKLRRERKALGMTVEDLAHEARISVITLYRLERGKNAPMRKTLEDIEKVISTRRAAR